MIVGINLGALRGASLKVPAALTGVGLLATGVHHLSRDIVRSMALSAKVGVLGATGYWAWTEVNSGDANRRNRGMAVAAGVAAASMVVFKGAIPLLSSLALHWAAIGLGTVVLGTSLGLVTVKTMPANGIGLSNLVSFNR